MAVKQTAGRDALGEFAPKFAQLNDDVLFGEVWSREDQLSLRDRALVTVAALMAQGLVDSSFQYHLSTAKQNGITCQEIAEILTHAAFYAGWPKAWAAFRMAKEVWAEDAAEDGKAQHQQEMVFPIGAPNDGFAQYFVGQSYLASVLDTPEFSIHNVTFEPGCRNSWHSHKAGQLLIATAGIGYYQEKGQRRPGRRTDSGLRGRPGLLPGVGPGGPGAAPRRRGQHPHGGQALARGRPGQLVLPSGPGGTRRELLQPVAGSRHRRAVRSIEVKTQFRPRHSATGGIFIGFHNGQPAPAGMSAALERFR